LPSPSPVSYKIPNYCLRTSEPSGRVSYAPTTRKVSVTNDSRRAPWVASAWTRAFSRSLAQSSCETATGQNATSGTELGQRTIDSSLAVTCTSRRVALSFGSRRVWRKDCDFSKAHKSAAESIHPFSSAWKKRQTGAHIAHVRLDSRPYGTRGGTYQLIHFVGTSRPLALPSWRCRVKHLRRLRDCRCRAANAGLLVHLVARETAVWRATAGTLVLFTQVHPTARDARCALGFGFDCGCWLSGGCQRTAVVTK